MKERPILFKGPMVRAILEGRKTQTRRVIDKKWLPIVEECFRINGKWVFDTLDYELTSPFGIPGDLLWVREAHAIFNTHGQNRTDGLRWGPWGGLPTVVSPDGKQIAYFREGFDRCDPGRWKPSIHMKRWASRISLEITNIRAERLNDITEADAMAEGCDEFLTGHGLCTENPRHYMLPEDTWKNGFLSLWDSINKSRGFGSDSNPWVWIVEFKRIQA